MNEGTCWALTPIDPWQRHKEVLYQLYMKERKSLKNVRSIMMAPPYNLIATEKEYERGLKRLGFIKNLKKTDWPIIDHHVEKRKRAGKRSEVFLCGELVPPTKRWRSTLRSARDSPRCTQSTTPTLPHGVVIRTPPLSPIVAQSALMSRPWSLGTEKSGKDLIQYQPLRAEYESSSHTLARKSIPAFLYMESSDLLINLPWRQFRSIVTSTSIFQNILLPAVRSYTASHWDLESSSDRSTSSGILPDDRPNGSVMRLTPGTILSNTTHLESTGDYGKLSQTLTPRHARLLSEIVAWFSSKKYTEWESLRKLLVAAMKEKLSLPFKFLFQANTLAVKELSSVLILDALGYTGKRCGIEGALQFFIDAGIDKSHFTGDEGTVLLEITLNFQRYDEATILLQNGASFDSAISRMLDNTYYSSCRRHDTAELLQEWFKDASVLRYLLNRSCLTSESSKEVVLMAIAMRDDIDGLRGVLDAGTDPDSCQIEEEWIVYWAYRNSSAAFYQELLARSSRAARYPIVSGVLSATKGGTLSLSIYLKGKDTDPDASTSNVLQSALSQAVASQNGKAVETLLSHGVDPNALAALGEAAKNSDTDLTSLLQRYGAKFTSKCLTQAGSTEYLDFILSEQPELAQNAIDAVTAAVHAQDLATLKILLRHGVDINQCDQYGDYPVHVASDDKMDLAILKILVSNGANVNAQDSAGDTPLLLLVANAHCHSNEPECYRCNNTFKFASYLIENGADTNTVCSCCALTVMELLCPRLLQPGRDVSLHTFKLFLAAGTDMNGPPGRERPRARRDKDHNRYEKYRSVLTYLIAEGFDNTFIQLALDAGADVNFAGIGKNAATPLNAAIDREDMDLAIELLKLGAHINPPQDKCAQPTPLQAAVKVGRLDIMRILLQEGADAHAPPPNNKSGYGLQLNALQEAAARGYMDIMLELLRLGADVNAVAANIDGRTALQAAARYGHLDIVVELLRRGARVNAPPAYISGRTALQEAAGEAHLDIVKVLLRGGADVNAPPAEFNGETTLQAACSSLNWRFSLNKDDRMGLIQHLLAEGADINAPAGRGSGVTALQAASERGDTQIAAFLLSQGADPNAYAALDEGKMAFDRAALSGNLDMIQLLLNAGARGEKLRGEEYGLAIELAKGGRHYAVVDLLKSQQGKRSFNGYSRVLGVPITDSRHRGGEIFPLENHQPVSQFDMEETSITTPHDQDSHHMAIEDHVVPVVHSHGERPLIIPLSDKQAEKIQHPYSSELSGGVQIPFDVNVLSYPPSGTPLLDTELIGSNTFPSMDIDETLYLHSLDATTIEQPGIETTQSHQTLDSMTLTQFVVPTEVEIGPMDDISTTELAGRLSNEADQFQGCGASHVIKEDVSSMYWEASARTEHDSVSGVHDISSNLEEMFWYKGLEIGA